MSSVLILAKLFIILQYNLYSIFLNQKCNIFTLCTTIILNNAIKKDLPNGILSPEAKMPVVNVNKISVWKKPTLMAPTQPHCLWTNSHNKATPGSERRRVLLFRSFHSNYFTLLFYIYYVSDQNQKKLIWEARRIVNISRNNRVAEVLNYK